MSIIAPLPFNIVNGTPEDASQVMADFNRIFNDVNANAARNGANADITQLLALSTPLSVSQGGTGSITGAGLADGGCRLNYTSGSQLTLAPLNGGGLFVNGVQQVVPAGGIVMSNTGSVSGGGNVVQQTRYYVYAYMNSAVPPVMTLECDTTGYTYDSAGRANKTTDVSRRLVGMFWCNAGTPGTFSDGIANNCVATFFNRVGQLVENATGVTTTTSTSDVQITGVLVTMVWADEIPIVYVIGYNQNTTAGNNTTTTLYSGVNTFSLSATVLNMIAAEQYSGGNANYNNSFSAPFLPSPNEGAVMFQIFGHVNGGQGEWVLTKLRIYARN